MELSLAACVYAVTVVLSVHSAVKFPEEDGVVVLTNETFNSALEHFPQLLVEFCSYVTSVQRWRITL